MAAPIYDDAIVYNDATTLYDGVLGIGITFGPPTSCDCCTGTGNEILQTCCPTGTGTVHRTLPQDLYLTITQTGGACVGYDTNVVHLVYNPTIEQWSGSTVSTDNGEEVQFRFGCCIDPSTGFDTFALRWSCIATGGDVGNPCDFPATAPQLSLFATSALCDPPDILFSSGLILSPCCPLIPGSGTYDFRVTA